MHAMMMVHYVRMEVRPRNSLSLSLSLGACLFFAPARRVRRTWRCVFFTFSGFGNGIVGEAIIRQVFGRLVSAPICYDIIH